jgi:colicin import membrane protein
LIAQAPQPHQFSAGVLALLVHIGFFAFLIFSVNWRTIEPPGMVVDLWANLPTQRPQTLAPPPNPESAPKPEPAPVKKIEPKPVPPAPIPKADIALKDKKHKAEKPKPKPEPAKPTKPDPLKQQQLKQEQLRQEEITRQQQAQAALAQLAQARQNAAQQSVVNDYKWRIESKIRQKLNRTLCGDGNPLLIFNIALLPTGQILGNPVLRKSSGIPACDKAVENAILQSDPLPVPTQPEIFSVFRDLELKFKPNE